MNRSKFIAGAALCAAAGLWIGASFAAQLPARTAAACTRPIDVAGQRSIDESRSQKTLMIVAPTVNCEHPAQVFRREIVCTGAVTRATLSITGLGVYETVTVFGIFPDVDCGGFWRDGRF